MTTEAGPSAHPLTGGARAVLELAAAGSECVNRWDQSLGYADLCDADGCIHCRAAELLPDLRCHCGKWKLDRASQSMWDRPISHEPEQCGPIPKATHCNYCKQALPSVPSEDGATAPKSAGAEVEFAALNREEP